MINQRLDGKVAVVTGGASGIGRSVVHELAKVGATVAVLDINLPQAETVVSEVKNDGGNAKAFFTDLADTSSLKGIADNVVSELGRIDILVNSAGITDDQQSLLNIDQALWDKVYKINLVAPVMLIQHVAQHMIQRGSGGRIVNISSSSAFRARFSYPAYGSSKAALNQITRTAAGELGAHDINVNAVVPGVTATPLVGKIENLESMQSLVKSGPLANLLERVSEPHDVAAAVLFLCLPASRQVTGQMLHTSAGAVV